MVVHLLGYEAYCLPFYLKTAPRKVARQLLLYRYQQLDKAIENAEKLGFSVVLLYIQWLL
ncbi:MAG: hypothetical protein CM15mP112_05190 [Flavobacteriales bacterium]|nr:MAG: hypothetical protein CM15mP112_05190 [Flavobacteriales bacterium]